MQSTMNLANLLSSSSSSSFAGLGDSEEFSNFYPHETPYVFVMPDFACQPWTPEQIWCECGEKVPHLNREADRNDSLMTSVLCPFVCHILESTFFAGMLC